MIAPSKIVLLILLVWALWFAMRWVNRAVPPPRRRPAGAGPGAGPQRAIEDLVACRTCGAYVAAGASSCGRSDCPQGR